MRFGVDTLPDEDPITQFNQTDVCRFPKMFSDLVSFDVADGNVGRSRSEQKVLRDAGAGRLTVTLTLTYHRW